MSDIEEPVAKMSKVDEEHLEEGTEEIDNGQEEWLSEEILTDDDYNQTHEQEQPDSIANMTQDGNNDSIEQMCQDITDQQPDMTTEENIEQTLTNFENSRSNDQGDLPEELGAFLIRKTDGFPADKQEKDKEPESDLDESTKQSEDDGHDTDELLRMLGEDNSKKTEVPSQTMQAKDDHHSSDDDDDEYIFEGAKVTRLKVSKDALMNSETQVKRLKVAKGAFIQKKVPSKAVPEDMSDREADNDKKLKSALKKSATSSDEAMTVKRMFGVRHSVGNVGNVGRGAGRGINAVKTVTKRVVSIDGKRSFTTSVAPSAKPQGAPPPRPESRRAEEPRRLEEDGSQDDMDEDHLDEDSQGVESDMDEEGGQRLMRPERMDEEVPSDAESQSDAESYYDELPSSESDDVDDWFTLDIRAERAADYIPLLGANARQLLLEEQQRAGERLASLRQGARALASGRRSLAAQLRLARAALTHLDAARATQ
ncbi:uncharacterized protein [Epargyreus clarus]|uniref:uncharacterized protein n=1 Tax=Epargyreus clarus TaxID=520877 RepID=UPI003C2DDDF8